MNRLMKSYEQYCNRTITDIRDLQHYSTEELQKEHIIGKWTMIQLIDHLLSIEKGVLMYMSRKSADPNLHKVKLKNRFYHLLTTLLLRSGKKIKAPSVVPEPANDKDIASILLEFEKIRSKTSEFIANWKEEDHGKLIFRHPLSGMFTLAQTVHFLGEHWKHHLPQKRALLNYIKK